MGDSRNCGAVTVNSSQKTVFVNGKLWAVQGDQNSHGGGGLIPSSGKKNVFIGGKLVIVQGDTAQPDSQNHSVPSPSGFSPNVYAYG